MSKSSIELSHTNEPGRGETGQSSPQIRHDRKPAQAVGPSRTPTTKPPARAGQTAPEPRESRANKATPGEQLATLHGKAHHAKLTLDLVHHAAEKLPSVRGLTQKTLHAVERHLPRAARTAWREAGPSLSKALPKAGGATVALGAFVAHSHLKDPRLTEETKKMYGTAVMIDVAEVGFALIGAEPLALGLGVLSAYEWQQADKSRERDLHRPGS